MTSWVKELEQSARDGQKFKEFTRKLLGDLKMKERKFSINIEEVQDGGYIARVHEGTSPALEATYQRQLVGSTKSQVRAKINKWLKEVL